MFLIAHRINTIQELNLLPENTPIEFDVRDSDGQIIVQHDPFKCGLNFEDFIQNLKLKSRFLIINIKSEGIEYKILEILKKYNINNYFFLDCSIPMIYKLTSKGEDNIAVRLSEFETIESVLNWKNKVKWVWIDCFYSYIITKEIEELLHKNGFKICLVSPELQGRPDDIVLYKNKLMNTNIIVDTICTKYNNFDIWNS
jgi:hypothetical protein